MNNAYADVFDVINVLLLNVDNVEFWINTAFVLFEVIIPSVIVLLFAELKYIPFPEFDVKLLLVILFKLLEVSFIAFPDVVVTVLFATILLFRLPAVASCLIKSIPAFDVALILLFLILLLALVSPNAVPSCIPPFALEIVLFSIMFEPPP